MSTADARVPGVLSEDGNEEVCGACNNQRVDIDPTLICCEHCPAAFHPDCAGYANLNDVPEGDWACWACARRLGQRYLHPTAAFKPAMGSTVYIAVDKPKVWMRLEEFYEGVVVDVDPQAITVQSVSNPDRPLDRVGFSSQRLWHGSIAPPCWQPQRCTVGMYARVYGAKSRIWQVVMPGLTAEQAAAAIAAATKKRPASGATSEQQKKKKPRPPLPPAPRRLLPVLPAPMDGMVVGSVCPSAAACALKAGDVVDVRSCQPTWAGAWIPAVIVEVAQGSPMEGGLRFCVDYAAAAAHHNPTTPAKQHTPMSPNPLPHASPMSGTPLSPGGSQGSAAKRRGPLGGRMVRIGDLPGREWIPLASRTETEWNEPFVHVRPLVDDGSAVGGSALTTGTSVEVFHQGVWWPGVVDVATSESVKCVMELPPIPRSTYFPEATWGLQDSELDVARDRVRLAQTVEPPSRFLHYGMLEEPFEATVQCYTLRKQLELMMQHIEGVKFFAAAMMELLPPLTQVRLPPPAGAGSGWLHGAPWRFPKHPTAVRRPRTAHPTKVKKQGGPACWDNTGTYLLRPESPPPKFRPQQQPIPLLTTRPPVATKTSPTAATAAAAKPARKPRVKQPQQQQQAPKPAAPQLQAMLMAALKARTSGGAGGPGPSSPQGTASPRAGPSPAPVPLKHSSMPSAAPRPVHVGNGAWSPRTVGSGQPVATPTSATGSSATPVGAGVQGAGGAPGGAHGAGAKGPVVSVWVEQMEHVSHVIPPPPPFFHHDHPRCSWCLAIPHHLGMLLPKSQMARSFSSLQCRWRPPSVLHKHGEQGNDHLDCSFVGDIRRASALIQCNNQTVGEALQPQHKIIPVV